MNCERMADKWPKGVWKPKLCAGKLTRQIGKKGKQIVLKGPYQFYVCGRCKKEQLRRTEDD